MSNLINIVLKDTSFVILTSISGSLMWQVCKDVYNYHIYNIINPTYLPNIFV